METMFKQYLDWYHGQQPRYGPQTAILMQVGKFFEIYDKLDVRTNETSTNIREIADLCSLNLSESRDASNEHLIKLVGGFPEASLPKFEKQLVENGYTVVVIVQKKNNYDQVESRVIDHISSPAIFEDKYNTVSRIQTTSDACLVGLLIELNDANSYYVGITAIENQTGQTWSTETVMPLLQGTPNIDEIEPFFMVHPPAEVVVFMEQSASTEILTETRIRSWFRFPLQTIIHIRIQHTRSPLDIVMREAYSMKTSIPPHMVLGLERHPQAYRCLGATLEFIKEHIPSLLKSLRMNTHWVPENRVRLGNAALEQLNIISNNNECLFHWFNKTYTTPGRRALRERLVTPIADVAELRRRFVRIDFLHANPTPSLEKHLRSVYDLARLHRKLNLGTASITDIQHLLLSYNSIAELIQNFKLSPCEITASEKVLGWLNSRQAPWDVERMKLSAATEIDRRHPWKRNFYTNLDNLEDTWSRCISDAKAYTASFSEPIQVIQGEHHPIEFTITKKRFEKIQKSHMKFHPYSTKATTGILESPETIAFQKQAAEIKRKWDEEHSEIWFSCLEEWSSANNDLIETRPVSEFITSWIANLDVEFSLARAAIEYNLTTPELLEDSAASCEIDGLRHLIIERINTHSQYVKHDICLGKEGTPTGTARNGLLIYGTNASGKSSLMKAYGIAVLSAQCGVPVAATSIKLSPYTAIFTRILSNDNLWASLSSFAVEMTEFRGILKFADSRSLILGDELCSGTETRSATAIFSAGIQVLTRRGAQFLFATHLHEIADEPEIRNLTGVKFAHLGVVYNTATRRIEYKRTLEPSAGSSKYGLEVCYGLDMDAEFLELANRIRETTTSRYNTKVVVEKCEICSSTRDVETHHIKHQVTAHNGFVDAGQGTHHASNLTALCSVCHDAHHAGRIRIDGWIDTSQGRELKWEKMATAQVYITLPAEINHFETIKPKLRQLIASKTKERAMIVELAKLTGSEVSIGELRRWKKQLR